MFTNALFSQLERDSAVAITAVVIVINLSDFVFQSGMPVHSLQGIHIVIPRTAGHTRCKQKITKRMLQP